MPQFAATAERGGGGGGRNSFVFGGWRHRASQLFFLLIALSLPLFSFPCQKGICSSPVEVVALHLLSIGVDEAVVKAMLYPAAVYSTVEKIVADGEAFSFPDWNHLLRDMNMTTVAPHKVGSSPGFGFLIGCYLCIVGAVLNIFGSTVVSFCGMITLLWYIYRDGGPQTDVFALPTFAVAIFCSFGGLKLEGKKSGDSIVSEAPSGSLVGTERKQN